MKFSELQQFLKENLGIKHLADIARELGVSPQAVSNWKSRDRVPYKYVIQIREKIGNNKSVTNFGEQNIDNRKTSNIKPDYTVKKEKKYFDPSTRISTNPFLEQEGNINKDKMNPIFKCIC